MAHQLSVAALGRNPLGRNPSSEHAPEAADHSIPLSNGRTGADQLMKQPPWDPSDAQQLEDWQQQVRLLRSQHSVLVLKLYYASS